MRILNLALLKTFIYISIPECRITKSNDVFVLLKGKKKIENHFKLHAQKWETPLTLLNDIKDINDSAIE